MVLTLGQSRKRGDFDKLLRGAPEKPGPLFFPQKGICFGCHVRIQTSSIVLSTTHPGAQLSSLTSSNRSRSATAPRRPFFSHQQKTCCLPCHYPHHLRTHQSNFSNLPSFTTSAFFGTIHSYLAFLHLLIFYIILPAMENTLTTQGRRDFPMVKGVRVFQVKDDTNLFFVSGRQPLVEPINTTKPWLAWQKWQKWVA